LRFSDAFFGARILDKFINELSALSHQLSARSGRRQGL